MNSLKKTKLIWAMFFFIFADAKAVEPPQEFRQVRIPAACKSSYFAPGDTRLAAKGSVTVPWDSRRAKPILYKDPRTALMFYSESDGRHVAAFDAEGKLLWVKNPYEDARYCPYRTPRPVIVSISRLDVMAEGLIQLLQGLGVDTRHKFLSVRFDSSQFGALDEVTGNFYPMGQD